ncbi:MAG: hypothetical protein OXI69_03495 [Acidobacteriota bacterium]|nr:hypothetical protein [Acidobacteriota bacterium]
MSDPKQKKQLKLLGALVVVLLLVLYWSWGQSSSSSLSSSGGAPAAWRGLESFVLTTGQPGDGRRGREIPAAQINSSIDFEELGRMEKIEPSLARNMFAFYTPPPSTDPNGGTSRQPPRSGSRTGAGKRPFVPGGASSPGRKAVDIPLKYYGFRKDPLGKKRQAFLADGDDLYLAWEGEVVANRFRIHRITDTMAEVEEVASRTRKRLNLELPPE